MKTGILAVSIALMAAALFAQGAEFDAARQIIKNGTPCSQLSEEQLEQIGDFVMEQMHPGEAHERMDAMMGGEGSQTLKHMHIRMAVANYCTQIPDRGNFTRGNGYYGGMMGGGMMGNWMMGGAGAPYGYGMALGGGYYGGMMGGQGVPYGYGMAYAGQAYQWLGLAIYALVALVLGLGAVLLYQKITEKK